MSKADENHQKAYLGGGVEVEVLNDVVREQLVRNPDIGYEDPSTTAGADLEGDSEAKASSKAWILNYLQDRQQGDSDDEEVIS